MLAQIHSSTGWKDLKWPPSLHFYQFPVSSGKEVRVEGGGRESILYLQVKCLPQSSPGILFPHSWLRVLSLAHLPQDKFWIPKLPQVAECLFEKPVSFMQNNTFENPNNLFFSIFLNHLTSPILARNAQPHYQSRCGVCREQDTEQSKKHKLRMFSGLSLWWSGALAGWIAWCHTDKKEGMIFDISDGYVCLLWAYRSE